MTLRSIRFYPVLLAALGSAMFCAGSQAQSYPAKPIRMIIPTAPGGPSDMNGRGIAQALSETYGQPVEIGRAHV